MRLRCDSQTAYLGGSMLHGPLNVTRQPALSPPLAQVTMTATGSTGSMTRSYASFTASLPLVPATGSPWLAGH